jgi:hypothetical protein
MVIFHMPIKSGWTETFYNSENLFRKYFFNKKPKKQKSRFFPDKQSIVDYIISHDIKSAYQLAKHYQDHKDSAPSVFFIRKYWGSWK